MYNKIFTKILDSSIWLEDDKTRLVWVTMIACMDEDGFCQMASIANLSRRAAVPLEDAKRAIEILERPDPDSSDPDNEGRRIERVPGGWMILNARKYAEQVSREEIKRKNRERVARFREKHGHVTPNSLQSAECNASVMERNDSVMQSDTDTDTDLKTNVEDFFDGDGDRSPEDLNLTPAAKPSSKLEKRAERESVKRVFGYFLERTNRSEKQYVLTPFRMQKGLAALEECKRRCGDDLQKAETAMGLAVDGLAENRFMMGENERRRPYTDWVDHLYKNVETIEKRWQDAGGLNV